LIMPDCLIRWLASGFGAGRVPLAPGLAGSLVGLGYWWLLVATANALVYSLATVAGILLAVWVSGRAARAAGQPDPAWVVIDELAVIPLVLAAGARLGPGEVLLGFVLFRVFDVWKPFPIRRLQSLPGGWGIVADDVLAAVYAWAGRLLVIAAWATWGPVSR